MARGEDTALRERPVRENVAERWEKIKDAVPTLTPKALDEQAAKRKRME